jgi:hypothetical protein
VQGHGFNVILPEHPDFGDLTLVKPKPEIGDPVSDRIHQKVVNHDDAPVSPAYHLSRPYAASEASRAPAVALRRGGVLALAQFWVRRFWGP